MDQKRDSQDTEGPAEPGGSAVLCCQIFSCSRRGPACTVGRGGAERVTARQSWKGRGHRQAVERQEGRGYALSIVTDTRRRACPRRVYMATGGRRNAA